MGRVMLVLMVCATVLPVITSSQNKSSKVCQCGPLCRPGNNGHNGINGIPGTPGRDGRDGVKGDQGKPGPQGVKGNQGKPGSQGVKGNQGKPGPQGVKGNQGKPGPQGVKGDQGKPGHQGAKGNRGRPGPKSDRGTINWKQCAWEKEEDKDKGLIKECIFKKKQSSTSLRVFYGGTLRVNNCKNCCKRWYFTFNGVECNGPLPIDGMLYISINNNIHRHRHIEGYCNNIPAGTVRVGFWVGNCRGFGDADACAGWKTVSRIVIEEVPPQQS